MIFAKVNVDLPTHQRFLRIPKGLLRGAALGMWTAATCWTRLREEDGFCPLEQLEAFGGAKVVEALVGVGLFDRQSSGGIDGVVVLRYADHNETKAVIAARRTATKKRVDEYRKRPRNAVTNGPGNALVPDSDSDSDSDLRSERDRDSGSLTPPPETIEVTEEIGAQCAMAGARIPTVDDVVECLSNARKKGHVRADWAAELVHWMVRGKRYDRPSGTVQVTGSVGKNKVPQLNIVKGERVWMLDGKRVDEPKRGAGG